MKGDFYPTDPPPQKDLPLHHMVILISVILTLLVLCGIGYWVYAWVLAPVLTPLTLPAGACVAPLCALIFKPRFVAKVMDTQGTRLHTAYPHHEIHVKPDPITLDDKVLYETQGSTWRGTANQRTFVVYAFKDNNGNWTHGGSLEE